MCLKVIALSVTDYIIIKVVQATHRQSDVRYGTFIGIPSSCMSLISVSWSLFKSTGVPDEFDLVCILGKRDHLFKFTGKFRYLWIEELPQEFLGETLSTNVSLCLKQDLN